MIDSFEGDGSCHPFRGPHSSGHLSWLHGLLGRTVLHFADIPHRNWIDHLLYRILRMFWRNERELLHDFDGSSEYSTTLSLSDTFAFSSVDF